MSFANIKTALRRSLLAGALDDALAQHGRTLRALADVANVEDLVAKLDALAPYTSARDEVLADLLRLWRLSPGGGALTALVYALHESVLGCSLRLTNTSDGLRERVAQVFFALIVRLEVFDPDSRTKKVQNRLEKNVCRHLLRARAADRRRQRVLASVTDLAVDAGADLATGTHALTDLIERRGRRPRASPDPVDESANDALRTQLIAHDLLRPREAEIVCRVDVQGQRIADVARALDMTPAAAKKALQRARTSLRSKREVMESLFMSPPETREGLL